MKKLFTFLAAVIFTLQMSGQTGIANSFNIIYDTWGAFELELVANISLGAGSNCPHLDSVTQIISNDTIFIETYYLHNDTYIGFACEEVDTIWANYNTAISTIVVCAHITMDTTQTQQGPVVIMEFQTSCETNSIFSTAITDQNQPKTLLKVTDVLGRKSKETKNTPLFYIYDDGTVEKRIIIE